MKRFFTALLVAILVVTSMTTVVAAKEAQPGATASVSVTVSGEFSYVKLQIVADNGLVIDSIAGAGAYNKTSATSAIASWAAMGNTDKVTFTVTVNVSSDIAPGTYYVRPSVIDAAKVVPMEEDTDGIADGQVNTTVSVSGGSITITAPECDHEWNMEAGVIKVPATCETDGLIEYTCTVCGGTKTEVIPAFGHEAEKGWIYDDDTHWHKCAKCDGIIDEADHISDVIGQKKPTAEEDGYRIYGCPICGRYDHTDPWKYNEPPKSGDIRPMMALGFAAVLFTMAAAAYVFKRKVNA